MSEEVTLMRLHRYFEGMEDHPNMNDEDGKSFKEIAAWIRNNL